MNRVILFFCIMLFPVILRANEVIEITAGPYNNSAVIITTAIITEAYKRLNLEVKIIYSSWKRSIDMAGKGDSDGELFRTENISHIYRDLLRVKVSLLDLDMVGFYRKELNISSWEDLSNYIITYLRGVKSVEQKTKNYTYIPVNSLEEAFRLLDHDRVDVVIEEYYNGILWINKLNLDNVHISKVPLESIPVYHYLHMDNANLLPLLEEVLFEMKADGTLDNIVKNSVNNNVL